MQNNPDDFHFKVTFRNIHYPKIIIFYDCNKIRANNATPQLQTND